MSADVRIDLKRGVFSAADISLDIRPVLDAAAVQVGGEDGPHIRALSFGERFSLVSLSAGSSDPADTIAVSVLQAATIKQGSRSFTAEETAAVEALALSMAGAETAEPGFINTLMKVAHATGWSMEQVDAAPAGRIDQMALQLESARAEADSGWTRLVFNPDANDENLTARTIRERLARNLLRRLDSNGGPQMQTAAPDADDYELFNPPVFGRAASQNPRADTSTSPGLGGKDNKAAVQAGTDNASKARALADSAQADAGTGAHGHPLTGDVPTSGRSDGDAAGPSPTGPAAPTPEPESTDKQTQRLTDPVPTAAGRTAAPRGTRMPSAPPAVRARVLGMDAYQPKAERGRAGGAAFVADRPAAGAALKHKDAATGGLKTSDAVIHGAARILHAGDLPSVSARQPAQVPQSDAPLSAADLIRLLNTELPAPATARGKHAEVTQAAWPPMFEAADGSSNAPARALHGQGAAAPRSTTNRLTYSRGEEITDLPSFDDLRLLERNSDRNGIAPQPEPTRALPTQAHAAERQVHALQLGDELARLLNEEADLRGID